MCAGVCAGVCVCVSAEEIKRYEGSHREYRLQIIARITSSRAMMTTELSTTMTATAQMGMVRVTNGGGVGSLLFTPCTREDGSGEGGRGHTGLILTS